MARLSDTASWSFRSRVTVALLVPLVAAAVVVAALVISNRHADDATAAGGTTADQAAVVTSTYAPAQPAGPQRSTTQRSASAAAPTDRIPTRSDEGGKSTRSTVTEGSDGIGSYDTQLVLAAKQAATTWVGKSMSMAYTDDFTARTRTLAAMLITPNDPRLAQWLTPSQSTVEDLHIHRTTITVQALVTRATEPATGQWAFDVNAVQTIALAGRDPQTVAAPYVVTVTKVGGAWKVVSMVEAIRVGVN